MKQRIKVYRGATSKLRRVDPYTGQWGELRRQVLARDQYCCQQCGSNLHLEIHHIVPLSKGGTNGLRNLKTLCHACHHKMPKHRHLQ